MKKRKHNFSIDDNIWKEFRMCCFEQDKTATEVIEKFIKKEVETYEKSKKKKAKIRQKK